MRTGNGLTWNVVFGLVWVLLFALVFTWTEFIRVSEREDFLTRQTARVAVLYWALAVGGLLLAHPAERNRWLWTFACLGYLIHVGVAFDQVHHWSHGAAFTHVEETSGWGPGIFVSYGFSLLWVVDVLWWWVAHRMYRQRNVFVTGTIHTIMAFVVFNGTVVYETGFIRWAGLSIFVILGGLLVRRMQ